MNCPRCRARAVWDRIVWHCLNCGDIYPRRVAAPKRLNASSSRAQAIWTPAEVAFVMANLAHLSTSEIAEALGRTEKGVSDWLNVNRIPKPYRRRDLTGSTGELVLAVNIGIATNDDAAPRKQ